MITSLMAQTTLETSAADTALFGGILIAYLLIILVVYVFMGFVLSKIFSKAGHPNPWAAWVPVYNTWVLFEIAGRPGWWALLGLTVSIPLLNFITGIAYFVITILALVDLSKSFGKDGGFAALLVILPIVGFPMLAFGDAQYQGAAGPEGNKFQKGNMAMPNQQDQNGPQPPTPPMGPTA